MLHARLRRDLEAQKSQADLVFKYYGIWIRRAVCRRVGISGGVAGALCPWPHRLQNTCCIWRYHRHRPQARSPRVLVCSRHQRVGRSVFHTGAGGSVSPGGGDARCRGACGAPSTSQIPRFLTSSVNSRPKIWSRSRSRYGAHNCPTEMPREVAALFIPRSDVQSRPHAVFAGDHEPTPGTHVTVGTVWSAQ